jgi:hypothetical protein
MNHAIRVAMFVVLMCCAPAGANVGEPPSIPGSFNAEVRGAKSVDVERETLRFDLRPLQESNEVGVGVTYVLHNPEGAKTLDLMFVGGHKVADAISIFLDGQPLAEQATPSEEVPDEWRPAQGKKKSLDVLAGWKFRLDLPPGKHTLELRYRALASYRRDDNPTRLWNLRYLLAPAKSWKSFGALDLELDCPDGWDVVCSLPVTRHGNTLVGAYQGLPAEELTIRANLRVDTFAARFSALMTALFAVASLGLLACCGIAIRAVRLQRSAEASPGLHLGAWLGGLLWVLALLMIGACWSNGPSALIPHSQRQLAYGYFDFQWEAYLVPVIVTILAVASLVTLPALAATWATGRRQRREA